MVNSNVSSRAFSCTIITIITIISPDSVWYERVLLLFSATAQTDTGSKPYDCAFVSTLTVYDDPDMIIIIIIYSIVVKVYYLILLRINFSSLIELIDCI